MKEKNNPPAGTLMGRRDMVTACGRGALAAASVGGLGLGLAMLWPRAGAEAGVRVAVGRPADMAMGQVDARHLSRLGFWLVRDITGLFAVSARCTHLGCRLRHDPAANGFRCMCHGSIFDAAGEVLRGPAVRAMDRFRVTLDAGGTLLVDPSVCLRKDGGGWQEGAVLPFGGTKR